MKIRLPAINGKTTDARLEQMEHYLRYLVETLNFLLRK